MTSPAPEQVLGEWHETLLRVRYSETDKMGIVYYANYLIWFEIGRTEFCRVRGFSYRDMEENEDAFLVVAESYCRYKAPAYYDDELLVHVAVDPGESFAGHSGREGGGVRAHTRVGVGRAWRQPQSGAGAGSATRYPAQSIRFQHADWLSRDFR